jgi:predicted metalloprotease with PDZ domain
MPGRLVRGALLLTALIPTLVSAAVVGHRFSFPELGQQYLRVESQFPVSGTEVDFRLANWIPGSYKIRDFSQSLDRIAFYDSTGAPLPFTKTSKNTWRVEVGAVRSVTAQYHVHAGELSVRHSWVSSDFVLINPATAVLYTDATRQHPQNVLVEVPAGMGQLYTPLALLPDESAWQAADFDELVDSPLVIAGRSPASFQQDDHTYHLLNVGEQGFWDTPASVVGLKAVVKVINDFWGDVPLTRDYWFFNFLVEGRGGLEHDHSTVMFTSRWNTRNRDDFISWLSLASHEYFHVWNVRRMRPEVLEVYDYEAEQYTASLWIAEGLTSYYDNLLLSRAGLVSGEEYLKLLAKDFHRLEMTPGRRLISLEQASRDAWIRQYGESANRINSNVSYYTKGAVVGFALDQMIRQVTRERRSLDDVLREMYQRWSHLPYPEGALREEVRRLAGDSVADRLEPWLSGTSDPDLDQALAYYGLMLDRHPVQTAAEQSGTRPGAGLGVNWDSKADGLIVGASVAGTAAAQAGLVPGDELIAINGLRVRKESLSDRLLRLDAGERVELLVSRHDRLFELTLELDLARPERYEVLPAPAAGKREMERLQSWLGQPLKAPADG